MCKPCLNVWSGRRKWLITIEYMLSELLPICCVEKQLEEGGGENNETSVYGFTSPTTVQLESEVRDTAYSVRWRQ